MSHIPSEVTVPWQLRDAAFAERIMQLAHLRDERAPQPMIDQLRKLPLVAQRRFDPLNLRTHCVRGYVEEHEAVRINFDGQPAMARSCRICGSAWIELLP